MLLLSVSSMLLFGLTANAASVGDVPPITEQTADTETGTIRITLQDGKEGTSKTGVVFGYKLVGDIVNGDYETLEPYAKEVNLNEIETAQQMEEAALKLQTKIEDMGDVVSTDENGTAEIKDLKTGVYLVYVEDQAGYEKITPFTVSIPTWSEVTHEMQYTVEVLPKHEPLPEEHPVAPQTNLDSRHNRLLALGVGSMLLAGGMFVLGNRKKKETK